MVGERGCFRIDLYGDAEIAGTPSDFETTTGRRNLAVEELPQEFPLPCQFPGVIICGSSALDAFLRSIAYMTARGSYVESTKGSEAGCLLVLDWPCDAIWLVSMGC